MKSTTEYLTFALGLFCVFLVAVDIVGNNWELNNFVGDAKHLFTPLLNINSTDELLTRFSFPMDTSPLSTSEVGRWMVQTIVDQVHDDSRNVYHLTKGQHLIQNPTNDVCGALAKTYCLSNVTAGSVLRLGTVQDQITFNRGNTLTHLFDSTMTDPQATPGNNVTMLSAMGYVPGRVGFSQRPCKYRRLGKR
ncbi:Aste57867_10180 [Aphanomyces stellatus]|uniref:Aste57867_10180 protein n=1 Tax=Aphanomyces stellatus TaxID=120398 RepID=A0A485KQP2_9STRA|nr:hypothetical protein As57867_010141 [Aphanomyces stellatus]VFT87056.1 Aste57867_10180 [Aphanomyces stellatus]